ncbi:TetR/AcrR family transcriptional regulator [uncultured Corynebacterium sp.]|uniref:TetR/AcrR family transcriptional regulator n=1 Tax=uncultured Corynebacterium sp. TaxID=159447 RepID=UPI00260387E2|nr:TetR/AcrR family transcriptional regulator [uncultured Corynebacterium sp.]
MPKITESTVAQHRAVQHRAVLEAAERLIVAEHGKVPTLAEVAAEVGLARSSIYRYVSSQHDLMVQLLVLATENWNKNLDAAIATAPPEPTERICAYVDAMLDLFVHGSHGPLMAAAQHFPEAFADEEVQESHSGFNDIVKKFCPGATREDIALLNAAIIRASEMSADADAYAHATKTLHNMARAIVKRD